MPLLLFFEKMIRKVTKKYKKMFKKNEKTIDIKTFHMIT